MIDLLLSLALAASGADQPPPPESAPPPGAEAPSPPAPSEGEHRHRFGPVFLSPMGEPFRSDESDQPGMARWFAGADADHDGAVTEPEMEADAAHFFASLDTNHDGEIDPTEIERYETEIAPEIHQLAAMVSAGAGYRA